MMLGPLKGKYTDTGGKGWRQEGLQLASLPMTSQGTLCFSSPQLWTLWDSRFWLSKGYTLAKEHSKSSHELQAITARRVLWTPFIQGHWGNWPCHQEGLGLLLHSGDREECVGHRRLHFHASQYAFAPLKPWVIRAEKCMVTKSPDSSAMKVGGTPPSKSQSCQGWREFGKDDGGGGKEPVYRCRRP